MEWLEGEDLAARLARGRLEVEESVALAATAQAARCALDLRPLARGRPIALAVGRSEQTGRPMSAAIDRAAQLAAAAPDAVVLDEIAAGLLDARFEVREGEGLFTLHGERALGEATRLLLGRATPCVGREKELGLLRALLAETAEEGRGFGSLRPGHALGAAVVHYPVARQGGTRRGRRRAHGARANRRGPSPRRGRRSECRSTPRRR
ncbi:hypothetical protein [Sorangium sp. So ce861]|uniref:hypothetical protein n=1 Tax=Sorangium sp. So ce861 TaxID=3133323 RepID=UPI003F5DCBFD